VCSCKLVPMRDPKSESYSPKMNCPNDYFTLAVFADILNRVSDSN